jgi:serine/threonine protein kinase
MYTLIYGRPPFESKDVKETYKKIKSGIFTFPDNLTVSQSLKDLIVGALQKDPAKRPTVK